MEESFHHSISAHIVSNILDKDILDRASRLCIPRELLHKQCCKIAENIQSSLIKVSEASPDRSPISFSIEQQSGIKNLVDASIKKIGYQLRPQVTPIKPLLKKPISRKSRKSILLSQNFLQSVKKINFLSTQTKLKSQLQVKLSNKRLLPCLSAYENENIYDTTIRNKTKKSKQAQEEERADETIKILRENKLNSNILYSYSVDRNVATKRDEVKKIKENQPKNCIMISTDYEGNAVPLNKHQINRQISHYIDIQINIPEEETQMSKLKIHPYIPQKQSGLKRQYANYKEIKIGEQQDRFFCNIINNVKDKRVSDSFLDASKCEQRNSKQFIPMDFIGKDNKPIRVGFDLFEKLKKGASLFEKPKQEKKSSKNNMNSSIIKKSIFKKKQSEISIQFQSFNQTLVERKMKKKESVSLGSPNAVDFLLNEDRKPKKVVTINEQFL